MLKKSTMFLAVLAIAAASYAAYVTRGHGKVATATTTPAIVLAGPGSNDTANVASIYNTGNETILFMKNATTGQFSTVNAIPIPSGSGYSTIHPGGGTIRFVCIASATNTSTYVIAFE